MGMARFILMLAAAFGAGCARSPECASQPPVRAPARASSADAEFGAPARLSLDRAQLRAAGAAPQLLASLDSSVYRYFRALSVESSSRVCHEFRDLRWHLPVVAVHGDAHVAQFVVTPTTFGLEDYDQAGFGPAVVDIVRYASSLHLACREVTWPCDAGAATSAFLREYRASLSASRVREPPAIVERTRRRVASSRAEWLSWADALRQPLAPEIEQVVRRHWASFVAQQQLISSKPPAEYYELVGLGSLQLGVGSALETKYLFRVRGATDSPTDDVILEARSTKVARLPTGVWSPHHGGSLHSLYFMYLLGPRLPEQFGTAVLNDDPSVPEFWLQSWEPGYAELALSDLQSQLDLEQLAVDAARQLAGHFWTRFPEALRPAQRFNQLRAFDATEARARELAKALADETLASWQQFRASR